MWTADVVVKVRGLYPLMYSKYFEIPKGTKDKDAYEQAHWRERMHVEPIANGKVLFGGAWVDPTTVKPEDINDCLRDGQIFIPNMAWKSAMYAIAQYNGEKIPGKGNATWTKHFKAGIHVYDNTLLTDHSGNPILASTVHGVTQLVPAQGDANKGGKVKRTFPIVPEWATTVKFKVVDDQITEAKFRDYLSQAGIKIGLLMYRPANGGMHGMFEITDFEWKETK